MRSQLQEIEEAIGWGHEVLDQIGEVEDRLRSAKNWGWFDILTKGGFISALFKHGKLEEAHNAMIRLSSTIDRFNSEISDIRIYNDVSKITMGAGVQIADAFLDSILVDGLVQMKIGESQRELAELRIQTENALNRLYALRTAASGPDL